ncbi:hypothetical protein BS78_01G501200 [Paspalum vaginatum]|nr:hypothetical protein BS78_01G501200 [Paspalum vaginatum]
MSYYLPGGTTREVGSRRSPIPYRIGPLDYTLYVACKCGQKAALWISWGDENPGRRYLKCYHARSGGCNFISWYEGRVDPFVRGLLVDLRNAVWELKRERAVLKEELSEAVKKIEEQKLKMGRLLVAMDEGGASDGNNERSEMVDKKRPWLIALWFAIAAVLFYHSVGT